MNRAPILQVEDDENDVLLLRYAYESVGIPNRLISVRHGMEALHYLTGLGRYADRQQFPMPALVLSDIKMPRLDGLELLKWIRSQPQLRRLVVIILTASTAQAEVDRAYDLGANSFVSKPPGAEELTDLLRLIHAYWLGHHRAGTTSSALGG